MAAGAGPSCDGQARHELKAGRPTNHPEGDGEYKHQEKESYRLARRPIDGRFMHPTPLCADLGGGAAEASPSGGPGDSTLAKPSRQALVSFREIRFGSEGCSHRTPLWE